MVAMDIPYTISGLRKAGLTQARIGIAVGLKQTSISDMEAGKAGIKRPTYAVVSGLQQLAKDHGVPTEPQDGGEPAVVPKAVAAEPSS